MLTFHNSRLVTFANVVQLSIYHVAFVYLELRASIAIFHSTYNKIYKADKFYLYGGYEALNTDVGVTKPLGLN